MKNVTPTKHNAVTPAEAINPIDHTLPVPLADLAQAIVHCHDRARQAAQFQVLYALRCGILLLKAKEQIPHGGFLEWLESSLPTIHRATANRYMQLLDRINDDKCRTVRHLQFLQSPTLDEDIRNDPKLIEETVEKVGQITDKKTLTDLYKGYGIIKPTKLDIHGTNNPEGSRARPVPSDPYEDKRQKAANWAEIISSDLKAYTMTLAEMVLTTQKKSDDLKRSALLMIPRQQWKDTLQALNQIKECIHGIQKMQDASGHYE
jgi:hypothetical protein